VYDRKLDDESTMSMSRICEEMSKTSMVLIGYVIAVTTIIVVSAILIR